MKITSVARNGNQRPIARRQPLLGDLHLGHS